MPAKRVDADTTTLDLNTTAKKNGRAQDKLNPYLANNTYCVIKANLAFPIQVFDEVAELKLCEQLREMEYLKMLEKEERQLALDRGEELEPVQEIKQENKQKYQKKVVKDKIDPNDAIYERMVILLPYKAPD